MNSKRIVKISILASVYALLSIVLPISSGPVQLRVAEGICMLPLLFFDAVPAIFIGCIITNIFTGCALLDIILGSLISLVSALMTYLVGRIIKNTVAKFMVGGLFPVLLNAFLLPIIWLIYGAGQYAYIIQVGIIAIGQALAVYGVGVPLYYVFKKYELDKK